MSDLTIEQVAQQAGRTPEAVLADVRAKVLPGHKLAGVIYVSAADAAAYVKVHGPDLVSRPADPAPAGPPPGHKGKK